MSHLTCGPSCSSEGNPAVGRLMTSQNSIQNPLPPEGNDNESLSKCRDSPSLTPVNKEHDEVQEIRTGFGNLTVNDTSARNESESQGETGEASAKAKRRRPRRYGKTKLKLQMPAPGTPNHLPQAASAPVGPSHPPQNEFSPRQFMHYEATAPNENITNFFSQLYASTSSRYLENLMQHPQFQYQHRIQVREIFQNNQNVANMVSRHLVQQVHSPISVSSPFLPPMHSEPTTPRYLQNVLQHPLLSRSVSDSPNNIDYRNFPQNQQTPKDKKKPRTRTRSNRKKEDEDDKRFEQYISKDEVEEGLKNDTLLEGVIRINPKQFQHAYVASNDRYEQDILIDGIRNRNRALEGDIVIVQYEINDPEANNETTENNDNNSQQKRGKVVYIKERVHTRTCIGTLKLMPDKNRQKALFVPRDHRIPRLNIPFTCWPDNFYQDAKSYENTLFSAKIIDWYDTRFAVGQIICNIGQSGDMVSETKAILAQTDLDVTPYGPEVRNLFPRLDYTIPEEELKLREDCRKMCIFSIDPFNCRDIDDAVSCVELENGNYEIGVHISDVAHFLAENTILDEKVADKATTIYLVERAYHMLPDELCMLCSLFPGVDKLAFSVFWEITKDAQVLSSRFAKTIIHSCAQLAYDHAQAVLDDKDDAESTFPETYNGYRFEDISKSIKIMGSIARIFRRNRFENGALRIDQPKVSFHLNTTSGLPESFWIYESKESHQLIEEFMLLANMTVAKRIYEDHPDIAFLRCHPPPSGYMLKQLSKALKPMGIDLDILSAGELHKSLIPYVGPESTDRGRAMVLSMLCAKPMARAKYFCSNGCDDEDFHHYALNVPLYTHFTSPIRRYADIMVHRLLAASLKYRDVPNWEVDSVRMVAAQCNKQKYNAKRAGELSTELYTLKYIEMHSPVVTEAVVVDVREKYIDTIVVAMGLNRRIFFNNDFPGSYKCIKNDAGAKLSKMEITWNATEKLPPIKQTIEVFSTLQVEMHKGDDMVKVETKLLRPIPA